MGLILYGVQQTPIGADEFLVKCPCCEKCSYADIMIISRYFHVYFIPFFPTEKSVNIICKECGLKRYAISFDENLIINDDEIKRKYKHPWFTYIGLAVIVFIILSIVVAVMDRLL